VNLVEEAIVSAIDVRESRRRNFAARVSRERRVQERRLYWLSRGYIEDESRRGSFYKKEESRAMSYEEFLTRIRVGVL